MIRKTIFVLSFLALFLGVNNALFGQHSHPKKELHKDETEMPTWPKSVSEHNHSHKGVMFFGGALSLYHDVKAYSTSFSFHPEGGYLLSDRWGIGVLLGIGLDSHKEEGRTHIEQEYKVSPFVRWYYFRPNPFNLYLDMGAGWNLKRTNDEKENSKNLQGYEIGIRPGACIDLIEGLCLCLRLGFIGYRHSYFAGEEKIHTHNAGGETQNGFMLHFAPEEAMIGLELEF